MEGGIFVVDVHIVQKGDTLWKISRQYGISFEELKRVNAHLANPDYIVPGMKIFLPETTHRKGEVQKKSTAPSHVKQEKQVEQVKKVEQAPVKKPAAPVEELRVPKEPIPIPVAPKPPKVTTRPVEEAKPAPPKATKPKVEQPKAETKPKPKKPVETAPTTPRAQTPPPMPAPAPPMPQMAPMQPFPFTVIGIPCGWLPIYDADCFPHVHPHQMQPMPMPQPTMPPPMTQLPVRESSHFKRHHQPVRPSISDEYEKMESPMKKKEKIPAPSQPRIDPALEFPTLAEPEPMPEPVAPTYEMPMQYAPEPMPFPDWQFGQQGGYPAHPSPCGCGQHEPMPMPMPMPVQHHHFCNACNQPIGQHPFPMMPYPVPYHWHGMY